MCVLESLPMETVMISCTCHDEVTLEDTTRIYLPSAKLVEVTAIIRVY